MRCGGNHVHASGGTGLAAPSFRAFLSYSHADKADAQRLHRKLETYRLPGHRRHDGTGAQADGRIGKVFRDREDLPAAGDLSASVRQALAASQALIVLCSPDAKASRWVAREIALFRELHPDRPILAALLRGEPDEAFPELLRDGSEPLAADLRKQGDGFRLGFLKVVAGVVGLPLDALIQRDSQRQMRRVMAVTAMVACFALAMGVMTVIALNARSEAQRQQAEAEGLIEYMLTDLREDLNGVGRLDVMTDVNRRALNYYSTRGSLAELPVESLERRSRILHAMGEDDTNRGKLAQALRTFMEAHRTSAALLDQDPSNPDRIFHHAQSEYWVGRIFEFQQDGRQALARYQSYRDYARQLGQLQPDTFRSTMEIGYAENNIGMVQLRLFDEPELAESSFKLAATQFKRASQQDKNAIVPLVELGNALAWESDCHFFQRDWKEALRLRRKERTIIDRLRRIEPNNQNFRYRELVNRNAILEIKSKKCDCNIDQSWDYFIDEDVDKLFKSDLKNQNWKQLRQTVFNNLFES